MKKTKARIYTWSGPWAPRIEAQIVGETLDRIYREEGLCPADRLVDEARPSESPLHPAFEWDDGLAGELYRREQARHLLRGIRYKTEDGMESTPVFVRVRGITDEGGWSGYKLLEDLTFEEYTQVEAEAASSLRAIRHRHSSLQRFKPVWQAIDQLPI